MGLFTAAGTALMFFGTTGATVTTFATATAAVAAAMVLNTVVAVVAGLALSALTSAFMMSKPSRPSFSVQTDLRTGGTVPRSFILGRTATAGSFVYANEWTFGKTPNNILVQVFALSDVPVQSLDGLLVDGERVTIDYDNPHPDGRGFPVTEYNFKGKDHLWVKFYDGTQTVADSYLVNTVSSPDRIWSSTRVGRGVAYAIVSSLVQSELFSGIPQCLFEITGLKLYDISRDTSMGGSGPQRWNDPSTWGGDGDHLPAVMMYNVLMGIRYNGAWLYGPQKMTQDRLPADNWIEQINKCRTVIAESDGNAPTYTCGGEIAVTSEPSAALEAMMTACHGRIVEIGGVYRTYVGTPSSPMAAISDQTILSSNEQTFTPFFSLSDTVNSLVGEYNEPDEGWNKKMTTTVTDPEHQAQDGDRILSSTVDMEMVYREEQAQRLLRSNLNEFRRARRHTIALPAKFFSLEPGDVISWTSETNGYSGKEFRVDGVVILPGCDIVVDMTEIDPSDYDWTSATDYAPSAPAGSIISNRPAPQDVEDWSVEAWSLRDSSSVQRRPALRFTWDSSLDDVRGISINIRVQATAEIVYLSSMFEFSNGSVIISQGILPQTQYQARIRYIPDSDRTTNWSEWRSATTGDIRLSSNDLSAAITNSINSAISTANEAESTAAAAISAASINADLIGELEQTQTFLGAHLGGPNLLKNSEFRARSAGDLPHYWAIGGATGDPAWSWGVRALNTLFSGATDALRPIFLRRPAGNASDTSAYLFATDARTGTLAAADLYRVAGGAWIEMSANLGASNGRARLWLQFKDETGTTLANFYSSGVTSYVAGRPDLNTRVWLRAQAPAGATRVVPLAVLDTPLNTAVASDLVLLRPMLAQSDADSIEPRPYAPSGNADAAAVDAWYRQSTAVLATDGVAVAQDVISQGARIGDAEADISTISTTKVDASGAVAAVNSQVSAGSGGDYATASDLAFAQKDTTGKLSAARILGVDAGGNLAEIAIGATPTSSFLRLSAKTVEARADRFRVLNPDGANAKTIFSVEDGQVVIDGALVLKGQSVNTGQLAANAAAMTYTASGSSGSLGGSSGNVMVTRTLATVAMPRAGAVAVVLYVQPTKLTETRFSVQINIDGVQAWNSGIIPASGNTLPVEMRFTGVARRDVASGSRAVTMTVRTHASNDATELDYQAIVIASYA